MAWYSRMMVGAVLGGIVGLFLAGGSNNLVDSVVIFGIIGAFLLLIVGAAFPWFFERPKD